MRSLVGLLPRCVLLAAGLIAGTTIAAAEDDAGIAIELNNLQQAESACRLSLVFTNGLPVGIDALELETVLFDTEGRAGRFLVLKSQPLIPGKVRVHRYDLDDTPCESIGAILVNDVVACDGEGLTPPACVSRLRLTSREKARLFLTTLDRAPQPAAGEKAAE